MHVSLHFCQRKYQLSNTSTPPCTLMPWCSIKRRNRSKYLYNPNVTVDTNSFDLQSFTEFVDYVYNSATCWCDVYIHVVFLALIIREEADNNIFIKMFIKIN